MDPYRIALANLRYPTSPAESVQLAENAIANAAAQGASILCFPECYVPGYRTPDRALPPPDPAFLEHAWTRIAAAAKHSNIAVILGTERPLDYGLIISALVIDRHGTILGFQDKTQIDPSEEVTYTASTAPRQVFRTSGLTFGISICHEGWRYPETVRYPAQRGAQIVFHPHFHEADPASYRPTSFADPSNTFHEKAALCRAAENTMYFATVNYASPGSPTTTALINPDGTLHSFQPYGQEGLLLSDVDLTLATALLARRCKPPVAIATDCP